MKLVAPLLLLLSTFFLLGESKITSLSSPFRSCGKIYPNIQSECFVLQEESYSLLQKLPLGGQIKLCNFQLPYEDDVCLLLTRFSAAENQEDLEVVVLLRGAIYSSPREVEEALLSSSSDPFEVAPFNTVFLALSPHGSNGYLERGNQTFILSTPYESMPGEDPVPEIDDFVSALSQAASRALGSDSWKTFSMGRASVLTERASLPSAPSTLQFDEVFPPKHVIDETQRKVDEYMASPEAKSGKFVRRTFRVASDVDYDMYVRKGSNRDATSSYYYTLIGSASTIFRRDLGHEITSSYLYIYTNRDPYPGTASGCLNHMVNNWSSSTPSRSFATLVSAKSLGGGVAYVRVLCNTAWAYAVNGNMVGYFPTPLQNYHQDNWDIYVWAHETGHVWGGSHTHDLNPPADRCGSTPGCGATQGSILSYCHTCSGGMRNIYLNFHSYSINQMKPFVDSQSC